MKNLSRLFTHWLFRFCGSVKLAMLLLVVIIVATIVGTLVESRFDTSVAQTYIYDAPWFLAWLAVLGVNLIGAVLVRYPWKPHQTGFIITHAGIILILVGAIIGRVSGIEGSLTLIKGQGPARFFPTGQQVLRGRSAAMTESKSRVLNLDRHPPSAEHPQTLRLDRVKVEAIGFVSELGARTQVEKSATKGVPGVRLKLTSVMVGGNPVEQWLLLDDPAHGHIEFGPATIRFTSQAPPAGNKNEPGGSVTGKPGGSRELHFAFAKMPAMDLTRPITGPPTGIKSSFQFLAGASGSASMGELNLTVGEKSFTFSVGENLGRLIPLEGTPWTLKVMEYFADFRTQGKQPVSVSNQPNNPAVSFELLGPPLADGGPTQNVDARLASSAENPGSSELVILRGADGRLTYTAQSRSKKATHGEIKMGEEFSSGLGDWKCRVEEVAEHAVIRHEWAPLSADAPERTGAAGLLVRLNTASRTDLRWIRMGETTPCEIGGEKVELAFENKVHALGFSVELEKFEVEMNEGTQSPASFKSYVRFHDPKTGSAITRAVWMNNPANFPESAGAGFLGTSYKFSQASWNPNNLDETTLQVIRDPGWAFKWIGSLMLCGGLFTMFYLKPYPRAIKARTLAVKTAFPPRAAVPPPGAARDVLVAKSF